MLFTSGSTGTPKGVELPESQLVFVARAIARHNGLTAEDRGFNSLPLFHVNAEVVGLAATLVAGATLVLDRRFRRTGFWELLAARRVTWLNAVPAVLAVLAKTGPLQPPASPYTVMAGSVIPAVLVSGVNSDLPGPLLAQVSENVFDSASGKRLLIPQGSRLIGSYRNASSYGQQRVQVVWRRLIFPVMRGTGLGWPLRSSAVPGLSRSTPSRAVAKRLE